MSQYCELDGYCRRVSEAEKAGKAGWGVGERCQQTTHTVQRRPCSGAPVPSQSPQLTAISNSLPSPHILVHIFGCAPSESSADTLDPVPLNFKLK